MSKRLGLFTPVVTFWKLDGKYVQVHIYSLLNSETYTDSLFRGNCCCFSHSFSVMGGGGGGRMLPDCFFFCSADHEQEWPPYKVVFFG